MTHRFRPGTEVIVEMSALAMPFQVLPAVVVTDTPDLLALYFAAETTYLQRVHADGSSLPRVLGADLFQSLETTMVPAQYAGHSVLVLTRPGAAHAIHLDWRMPDWEFQEWYVNLQRPVTRTADGFRSEDQFLDIVVAPDRTWRWKDEDELAAAVAIGRLSADVARAVREEGERIVTDLETARWPFTQSMTEWRPDSPCSLGS